MKILQRERERLGLSRLQLSYEARVAPSFITQAEKGSRRLWGPESTRLAAALGWEGEPDGLLEDVADDARR